MTIASARKNLLVHRLLLSLAYCMLGLSLWMIHWYAMLNLQQIALKAHLCAWGSLWFGLRMIRHCERYEQTIQDRLWESEYDV